MRETLTLQDIVIGTEDIVADLETELYALEDWPAFPTGPLRKGQTIRSAQFHLVRRSGSPVRAHPFRALPHDMNACPADHGMSAERFRAYIDAFNRDDYSTFGDYYQDDVVLVIAGKTELRGREKIFAFYKTVKSQTRRTIQVNKVVVTPNRIAAELQSEFLALEDVPDFSAGPMKKGGRIFINTIVLYELREGKFSRIRSAELRKISRGPPSA